MRFAFFGDVIGRSGRDGLAEHLPGLRRRLAEAALGDAADDQAVGHNRGEVDANPALVQHQHLLGLELGVVDQK